MIMSTIVLIETIFFIPCIAIGLFYGESILPFLLSTAVTGSFFIFFRLCGRNSRLQQISTRDTFLIVTLSWLVFSLAGSLPYLFSNTIPSFTDAFFESSSGFTTTGASILQEVESLPRSVLFWRSLTHWIGGIGIIVLVIIILPSLNVSGYHLFSLESSLKEKIHPKARGVGFRIMIIYISLTFIETLLLYFGDMSLFDSICHAFGTVATGGFSTKNTSLMYFSVYSQYVVMIFMFLSGISQVVYYYLIKMNFRKVKHNEEFWFYLVTVIISGTLALCLLLVKTTKPFEVAFREGFFQVISVISCTGFATADYLLWPTAGIALIFLLMFSGGSTGSTSGGIKLARHLIFLKNVKRTLIRVSHPNAVVSVKLNGKSLDERTNISVISFIVLYFFIFITGTVLMAVSGPDLITSASSVATCLAGVGPGLGSVGPMSNFSALPDLSKIVLSLVMILGRLEIIPVFILFSRSFWKL